MFILTAGLHLMATLGRPTQCICIICAIFKAINFWLIVPDTRVRSRGSRCEILDGQNGIGTEINSSEDHGFATKKAYYLRHVHRSLRLPVRLSVSPYVCVYQRGSHWTDFHKA
jgi:hypothetical protein